MTLLKFMDDAQSGSSSFYDYAVIPSDGDTALDDTVESSNAQYAKLDGSLYTAPYNYNGGSISEEEMMSAGSDTESDEYVFASYAAEARGRIPRRP